MEKQVENAKKFKKNTKKEIKWNDKWKKIGIANVVFAGICSTSLFFGVSFGIAHLCWVIEAIGGLISIVWSALDNAKYKEKLKDLEKHEMYLEFSKIREKEASRILGEVREELKEKGATKKQIEEIPKTLENLDDEININTVHKMEYLEMKQLLENAKALKNIEFFSQTEQEKTEKKEGERTFQEKWEEYKPPKEKEVYTFQRRWKIMRAKEEQNSK